MFLGLIQKYRFYKLELLFKLTNEKTACHVLHGADHQYM